MCFVRAQRARAAPLPASEGVFAKRVREVFMVSCNTGGMHTGRVRATGVPVRLFTSDRRGHLGTILHNQPTLSSVNEIP